MNCIIVDDDELARLAVRKCIDRHPDLSLVEEYDSAQDALEGLKDLKCDIVFLDVEMPEMTGLEFISAMNNDAHIVIVSSKSEYAVEAYNFDVADYLTKPVDFDRFCKSVTRVENISQGIRKDDSANLFVKVDSKFIKLDLNEIRYIEALSDYVSIFTDKGRHIILGTMKSMVNKLDPNQFVRTHRSFIVNLKRIESIQEGYVSIEGKQIPVSRGSKENLMKHIKLIN